MTSISSSNPLLSMAEGSPFDMRGAISHFAQSPDISGRFSDEDMEILLAHFFGELPEMVLPAVTILEALVVVAFGGGEGGATTEEKRTLFVEIVLEIFGSLAVRAARVAAERGGFDA